MRLQRRGFPVKSAKFLRTTFPSRTPTVAPSDSINADEKKKKKRIKKENIPYFKLRNLNDYFLFAMACCLK